MTFLTLDDEPFLHLQSERVTGCKSFALLRKRTKIEKEEEDFCDDGQNDDLGVPLAWKNIPRGL